jgi:iron(III) transport system substrate-binding protein
VTSDPINPPERGAGATRRTFIRRAATAAAGVTVPGLLAACGTTSPTGGSSSGSSTTPKGPAGLPLARPDNPVTLPIYADNKAIASGLSPEKGPLQFYNWDQYINTDVVKAFEKKYGVKVQLWRSLSENVLARTITEARGRRHGVDVIETNSPELEALAREQLISEFISPHAGSVHAWAVPAHRLWIGDRVDLFVAAFNTDRVRREEMPESYEGFLDAKWKGRLALEATDQEWLGAIVKHWGEARGTSFFRRLADMQPDMRKGHVLLAQLVAAGEVPVGLTVYSGNAESIKRKGGPIDWAAVEPLVGRVQGLALAKNAPHPHAALLFADFVLSPEGMQLLHAFGRVPTSRDVKTVMDETSYVLVDPAQPAAETVRWQRMWKDLFGR